jgi:hypothetical protein
VSKNNGGHDSVDTRACYKCNKVGHIATYCPDKTDRNSHVTHTKRSEPSGAPREARVLASWIYIEPKDISVIHKDGEGSEWKFCTHSKCKATNKKGFFQLTHLDSEHNDEHWKTYKKVEANITNKYDDPCHTIPLGTLAVTTLEPTYGPEDEDEMTFTGAWFTPALPIVQLLIVVPQHSPNLLPLFLGMKFMTAMMTIVMIMTSLVMIGLLTMNLRSNQQNLFTRKKNSRANVQGVLSEAEVEGT